MATTKYLTADLKHEIDEHGNRIGSLEKEVGRHDERIKDLRTDVNAVCIKTEKLENVVIKSGLAISVGTWIVAGFGISVIALVWSLITGQAVITFR